MPVRLPDSRARLVFLRFLELGENPRQAAKLAGYTTADFDALAKADSKFEKKRDAAVIAGAAGRDGTKNGDATPIDPKVIQAYFGLLSRGFSDKEAALLVNVDPSTMLKVVKRSPVLSESRARAKVKAGFGVKAALINWAYRAVETDSPNAKWATKCLMAWFRECGLADPEVLEEQARGGEFQVDAVILARATHQFRQNILLGAEIQKGEQTENSSRPIPNFVESKVLQSAGEHGDNADA